MYSQKHSRPRRNVQRGRVWVLACIGRQNCFSRRGVADYQDNVTPIPCPLDHLPQCRERDRVSPVASPRVPLKCACPSDERAPPRMGQAHLVCPSTRTQRPRSTSSNQSAIVTCSPARISTARHESLCVRSNSRWHRPRHALPSLVASQPHLTRGACVHPLAHSALPTKLSQWTPFIRSIGCAQAAGDNGSHRTTRARPFIIETAIHPTATQPQDARP